MLGGFRRLPAKWQLLLGIQGIVTLGILGHRLHLLEQQKERQAAMNELRASNNKNNNGKKEGEKEKV